MTQTFRKHFVAQLSRVDGELRNALAAFERGPARFVRLGGLERYLPKTMAMRDRISNLSWQEQARAARTVEDIARLDNDLYKLLRGYSLAIDAVEKAKEKETSTPETIDGSSRMTRIKVGTTNRTARTRTRLQLIRRKMLDERAV